MPFAEVARLVARLAAPPAPRVITADRTDWYLGEIPLNVLLLGILCNQTSKAERVALRVVIKPTLVRLRLMVATVVSPAWACLPR